MEKTITLEELRFLQKQGTEIVKNIGPGATAEEEEKATDAVYALYTKLAFELTQYLILNIVNEIGVSSTSSAFLAAAFLTTTNLLRDIARNEHSTQSSEASDAIINDICELIQDNHILAYVSDEFTKGGTKHEEA